MLVDALASLENTEQKLASQRAARALGNTLLEEGEADDFQGAIYTENVKLELGLKKHLSRASRGWQGKGSMFTSSKSQKFLCQEFRLDLTSFISTPVQYLYF